MHDTKNIEQFIRTFKHSVSHHPDQFKNDQVLPALEQYENINKLDRKVDFYFANKRIDISEKLCFNRKSVATTMRVFFDSEVSDDGGDTIYIKLNIFGRLLLNDDEDLSHSEYFAHYHEMNEFERNLIRNFTFCQNIKDLQVQFENKDIQGATFSNQDKSRKGPVKAENINGFTIIRAIKRDLVTFPLRCFAGMSFESSSQSYNLCSDLAKFMGQSYATRREILDSIYDYVKKNSLLEENTIRLDAKLSRLFRMDPDIAQAGKMPLSELSSRIKNLLASNEVFDFVYTIENDAVLRKYMDIYDLKIRIPLELTPEIIPFYVSKLIFNEEEKKKLSQEDQAKTVNSVIRNNERTNQLQELIGKKFAGIKQMIARRESLKRISEDPIRHFEQFLNVWEQHRDLTDKQTPAFLGKRSSMEENEFTDLLHRNYDELLDKEIDHFLKNKLHH